MIKKATLTLPTGATMQFFFPGVFDSAGIVEAIHAIRQGSPRNWRREFVDLSVVIEEQEEISRLDSMTDQKYIVLFDKGDVHRRRYMILFPKKIDHDYMFEAAQNAAFESEFTDHTPINICSAGFMDGGADWGNGRSESLNIDSQKEDKKNSNLSF